MLVNGSSTHQLLLSATLPIGSIDVNPSDIRIKPVPLGVTVTGEFLVTLNGFAVYVIFIGYSIIAL